MKQARLLLFLLVAGVTSQSFTTEAAEEKGTVANGTGVLLHPKGGNNPNKRPNMPSRQIIRCTYDSSNLTVEFTVPEGICDVVVTEHSTGIATYNIIDSSELTETIFVGTLTESSIEISTEKGNVYSGILTSDW